MAINKNGLPLSTSTTCAGGLAIQEGEGKFHQRLTVRRSDSVEIRGSFSVDPAHLGQNADLLVVVAYQPLFAPANTLPRYLMLDSMGNLLPWNDDLSQLVPFQQVTLTVVQDIPMYKQALLATGSVQVYFGYRLADGTVVHSTQTINITITE